MTATLEVVGVRSAFWAADTDSPRTSVIIDAARLIRTGENSFDMAARSQAEKLAGTRDRP